MLEVTGVSVQLLAESSSRRRLPPLRSAAWIRRGNCSRSAALERFRASRRLEQNRNTGPNRQDRSTRTAGGQRLSATLTDCHNWGKSSIILIMLNAYTTLGRQESSGYTHLVKRG